MASEGTDFTENSEQAKTPDPDIMREISTFLDTCSSIESECRVDFEDFTGNVEEELIVNSNQKEQQPIPKVAHNGAVPSTLDNSVRHTYSDFETQIDEIDEIVRHSQEAQKNAAGLAAGLRSSFRMVIKERDQAFSGLQKSVSLLKTSLQKLDTLNVELKRATEKEYDLQQKSIEIDEKLTRIQSMNAKIEEKEKEFKKIKSMFESREQTLKCEERKLIEFSESNEVKKQALEFRYALKEHLQLSLLLPSYNLTIMLIRIRLSCNERNIFVS